MHLLVLTDRPGGGKSLLPSLEYLDHTLQDAALDGTSLRGMAECESLAVRGPVGLDIGAELPEGIALSIAAEIHAVLNQRDGLALTGKGQVNSPSA